MLTLVRLALSPLSLSPLPSLTIDGFVLPPLTVPLVIPSKGWPYCKSLIDECQTNTSACATAQTTCSALMFAPYTMSGMNPYNIELKVSAALPHSSDSSGDSHLLILTRKKNFKFECEQCVKQPLCYDFTNIGDFMNNATVKEILGVPETVQWEDCNQTGESKPSPSRGAQFQCQILRPASLHLFVSSPFHSPLSLTAPWFARARVVNAMFVSDWMKNFDTQVVDLLEGDVKVLIYAGDLDWICNWIGNKAWTMDLEWSHKDAFNAAEDREILPGGAEASVGQIRRAENFAFVRIYDAGHLAPMDQPEVTLQMVKVFTETTPEPPSSMEADVFAAA